MVEVEGESGSEGTFGVYEFGEGVSDSDGDYSGCSDEFTASTRVASLLPQNDV